MWAAPLVAYLKRGRPKTLDDHVFVATSCPSVSRCLPRRHHGRPASLQTRRAHLAFDGSARAATYDGQSSCPCRRKPQGNRGRNAPSRHRYDSDLHEGRLAPAGRGRLAVADGGVMSGRQKRSRSVSGRRAYATYLAFRTRLGFSLQRMGEELSGFARYLQAQGHFGPLTTAAAIRWARLPTTAKPPYWALRLHAVRMFAKHLAATDPRHEVPPARRSGRLVPRAHPHIYTPEEIQDLLEAAQSVKPVGNCPRTPTALSSGCSPAPACDAVRRSPFGGIMWTPRGPPLGGQGEARQDTCSTDASDHHGALRVYACHRDATFRKGAGATLSLPAAALPLLSACHHDLPASSDDGWDGTADSEAARYTIYGTHSPFEISAMVRGGRGRGRQDHLPHRVLRPRQSHQHLLVLLGRFPS